MTVITEQSQNYAQYTQIVKRFEDCLDHDRYDEMGLVLDVISTSEDFGLLRVRSLEGFSLLHFCAFKNKLRGFNLVLKHVHAMLDALDKNLSSKDVLKKWVDAQTFRDKFTALHYASFRGNIEMSKALIKMGANITMLNRHGLGVLHIAAQGDQPSSLYFFHKIMRIPIDSKDSRGSTPLHWACFSGSEIAVIYILAWCSKEMLAIRDKDGFTPLHLAVKSVETIQSTRPVKTLLYRDAPKFIRDSKGNLPINVAQ
jgi:palmitoyltransferase